MLILLAHHAKIAARSEIYVLNIYLLAPKKWSGARRICARYRSHMPSHSAKPDATQFEKADVLYGKPLSLILIDVEIASVDLEHYAVSMLFNSYLAGLFLSGTFHF